MISCQTLYSTTPRTQFFFLGGGGGGGGGGEHFCLHIYVYVLTGEILEEYSEVRVCISFDDSEYLLLRKLARFYKTLFSLGSIGYTSPLPTRVKMPCPSS